MTTSTMLIKCLLRRDGGSVVTMKDGATYHFKDDGLGNHVASVTNPDHIQRFMQIPEAYAIFSGAVDGVGLAQVQPTEAPVVTAPILAAVITGADPVTPDAAAEPTTETAPQTFGEKVALDTLSDADLRAVFKAEIGRIAPPKAKPETMIAQIEAIRAERGAQG